ncbi:MAG: DUF421 domain-containing protein [Heliobacteriaceae bacterium]|nr:DUF421 domain-containing protein [Heliobacteriaceae bacterium]
MELLNTVARTGAAFFALLLFTRILGKKQLSQLTYFNYIAGITLGSITATLAINHNVTLLQAFVCLATFVGLTMLLGYISLKSAKARVLLDGEPTILIKHGQVLEQTMKSMRLNIDDLSMMLRNSQVFNIQDVEYAILEPDGKMSVLKKAELEPVTRKDLQIPVSPYKFLPTEVISDGKLLARNLKELDLSREWLDQELQKAGVAFKDVFYAEVKSDGTLYIDKRVDILD